ncbi:glycoside hydrolase family 130 protein [Flavobacterium undicola]|uniref:glycoside hydrolase family 130 protein n=1 Tax=Flavobacterium undicola TaxID=1932779 RepID=UPI00137711F7|nr:pesticidal protein Cry7Aa [Flavobacterium undicola]MBA0884633.1 pesticidal protein Cry7Aa [Flavobacterium undicola]
MIKVKKDGIILMKTTLLFENKGVLNPAVIREGAFVHLFYRAVSQGNFSSIGYCKLMGPLEVEERMKSPLLIPEFDYESHGMEDPRIVKIEDLYYLTYTAYDGLNALGALATSKDLIHFEKRGIIIPQITYEEFDDLAETKGELEEKYYRYNQHSHIFEKEGLKMLLRDKNLIFFPRKINGKFCFLHRIKPEIQIVIGIESLEDLSEEFWKNYFIHFKDHILFSPNHDHEISYIGGGCPPIETEQGWLIIYHGVHVSINGYVYSACAALLDLENPKIEIARLPYPLFKPEEIWELKGEVDNVCFPTGAVVFDDTLYIYYGAADERIACASMSLSELLKELMLNKK